LYGRSLRRRRSLWCLVRRGPVLAVVVRLPRWWCAHVISPPMPNRLEGADRRPINAAI
jgi:hypothetical protein